MDTFSMDKNGNTLMDLKRSLVGRPQQLVSTMVFSARAKRSRNLSIHLAGAWYTVLKISIVTSAGCTNLEILNFVDKSVV